MPQPNEHETVFPRALGLLLVLLERRILQPREDLYTGQLLHPTFLSLHPDTMAQLQLQPFIATGGGALLRGSTLRRLEVSGTPSTLTLTLTLTLTQTPVLPAFCLSVCLH